MDGPLLSAKQVIPPVRAGVVPRRRLEDLLASSTTKLTAVVAPAGWGKTSLLSRWASAAATDTAIAWVSLDEADDEPIRFWSYVLTSLRRVSDQLSQAAAEALRASSGGPTSQALPILLNELTESKLGHVLVLDDYHLIADPAVHESLEFLLAYLPPTLRIVIASRWDPPLPLARMRVRGELTELRADDLRFSPDESLALVSAVSETELDAAAVTNVWERTEGWAAGLQLAGLALRDKPAATIRGDDRHLFDYFAAEVFPALAPRQRDLLVRAAPLELLSGSLCDAALDVEGSAEVLAELERAELFVVALDDEHEWYRCHRLLRDALLRNAGAETPAVQRRAASWFEEHGRVDDAVRHLLSAGAEEAAAEMLQARQLWFLEQGWQATYLALGERLPEAVVQPQLALFMAYAAEVSGHHERVVPWLDVCHRQIDESTVVKDWRSPHAAELSLRGLVGTPASDPARVIALSEESLALETGAGTDRHPVAMVALGGAYGLGGRFDEGARILAGSWRQRGQGHWSTGVDLQVAGLLSLFLLALDRADELDRLLVEAGALAAEAERDWGDAGAAPVVGLIRLVQSRRSYQRGDLTRAKAELDRGLALADVAARPLFSVVGFLFLADLELGTGQRAAARAALIQAREVVDNEPVSPFLRTWLEEAETRIGRAAVQAVAGSGVLIEGLTDRELSILRLLPGSATQREIGAALFLSINTVKAYNKSLYRKLGVGGRQDAVRAARQLGLI